MISYKASKIGAKMKEIIKEEQKEEYLLHYRYRKKSRMQEVYFYKNV